MRIAFIGSTLAVLILLGISPCMHAQTSAKPGPGAATGPRSEEPEMQPWADEKYKAARVGRNPNDFGRQDLDPTFSGCMPQGPTDLMLDGARIFELRQFPVRVALLSHRDPL